MAPETSRQGRVQPGWTATDLALGAGAAAIGAGLLLWAGAAASCLLTGRPVPELRLLAALAAVANFRDPGAAWPPSSDLPGPVAYWLSTALVVVAAGGLAVLGWRVWRRMDPVPAGRMRTLAGLAKPAEANTAAGERALLARAPIVRPSTRGTHPRPAELGYRIGQVGRHRLWCSVEDSILLVGPPRMGKGLHLVIPWILDAPGPVVATSTRPDTLAVTLQARKARGPVAVFDPQRLAGLPEGMRWSPIRGCETPRTAFIRARGLACGVGFSKGVTDGDFWSGQTETVLRCLLHAAAIAGANTDTLFTWSLSPDFAQPATEILANNPTVAVAGWADALDATIGADPRTRDSVWMGVRQALGALADPDVRASLSPRPGEGFDPGEFLTQSGTLHVIASSVGAASTGPLLAAFLEDITETARARAATSTGARLDPPLLFALDEIANITPLPSLPSLMAEGGGSGITTLAVFQSLAQARNKWGQHAADTLWDAATVKIVLGGLAKMTDLEDVAKLLGEIDQPTQSISRGRAGERTTSIAMRQQPVMPPALLRTLPFGSAVVLLRHTKPTVVDLKPWHKRPDAKQLHDQQAEVEQLMRSAGGARETR